MVDQALNAHLRRQAIQIAAQLPEDPREALKVLAYADRLVCEFLADDAEPQRRETLRLVVPFKPAEA